MASHGQTIYHLPHPAENEVASTLQIGEPAIIAYDHRVKVIANFRVMDMAAGGQGAPLVPYSERVLYGKKGKIIALQNIGGIGNLTILSDKAVVAFDTGPGNMMIDQAMKHFYQKNYDENGDVAASGQCIDAMLKELMSHPFLDRKPPKTTGREDFGEQFVEEILNKYPNEKPEDIVHTFTQFTASSISYNYIQHFEQLPDEILLGGGGAYNKTLITMLKEALPTVEIKTQEDIGMSSEAKEAIAFVILGNETMHHRPSNECGATGAKTQVILGTITENPFRWLKEEAK
ncbi:MAG: anhydro-N-acetylmuramic acid kinase [Anaerorhabdus sp.]|uniref:anhydro-N-acetylmuramic acid kinase n=1 Tax=Anaerorhabdus sp. TaxID=1872524 RepID=UPI003A8AC06F